MVVHWDTRGHDGMLDIWLIFDLHRQDVSLGRMEFDVREMCLLQAKKWKGGCYETHALQPGPKAIRAKLDACFPGGLRQMLCCRVRRNGVELGTRRNLPFNIYWVDWRFV